jgi:hypothetical protein
MEGIVKWHFEAMRRMVTAAKPWRENSSIATATILSTAKPADDRPRFLWDARGLVDFKVIAHTRNMPAPARTEAELGV